MVKKKSTKFNDKLRNFKINIKTIQILSVILLATSFVCLVSKKMGLIGDFFNFINFGLFGLVSYLVIPVLMSNIVICMFNKFDVLGLKKALYIYLLLLVGMIIVDMNTNIGLNFGQRISNSIILSKTYIGAGVIGAFLSFISLKLLGVLGTYLLAFVVIFLSILAFMDLKISVFFKEMFYLLKKITSKFKNNLFNKKKKSNSFKDNTNQENYTEDKGELQKISDLDFEFNNYKTDDIKSSNYKVLEDDEQLIVEDFASQINNTSLNYKFPPIDILKLPASTTNSNYKSEVEKNARAIEETMKSFRIDAKVTKVNRGPAVTCYELAPKAGIKLSSIVNLSDNLALSLASSGIRIEAPIPGKSVVGIEVPNKSKDKVLVREIISSNDFSTSTSFMPIALGKDIEGNPVISQLDDMPHMLIAGATGSGKSVCINTIITSILYKSSPDDVKMILIDPKMVELNVYSGIPHLVIPVVTEPKKASGALNWAVREMERRYQLFSDNSVRDIKSYKSKKEYLDGQLENMPYIVIIVDELADLMMVTAQEVEDSIARIAQLGRAAGLHLIIATQRPSVDVITGTIKANIQSRIAFSVSSQIDSRTILDMSGAEKLLGYGDMLFYPRNFRKPKRIQGAFVSEKEVHNLVAYIKNNHKSDYSKEVIEEIEVFQKNEKQLDEQDDLLSEAVDIVLQEGQASVSLLQRRMRVGYARAGRMIDEMETLGIVGPHEGSKPRRLLVNYNILNEGVKDEYSE